MAQTQQFNELIQRTGITPDPAQVKAIEQLEIILQQFNNSDNCVTAVNKNEENVKEQANTFWKNVGSLFSTWSAFSQKNKINNKPVKGLYIWGDVGRGKTWLMDQFYASLSISQKLRIHFHQFMQQVHQRLEDLPTQPDPLEIIGHDMAKQYRIICLDEFHVMDIADAVILHGLLKALFENGVTLITTSNRQPDDLYKNGSRRERFLPAIELIKRFTHVFHLDAGQDYRLDHGIRSETFLFPHNDVTKAKLNKIFDRYVAFYTHNDVKQDVITSKPIRINNRDIPVIKRAKSCIWFDFDTLCRGMRASSDYIAMAERYELVILSGIPLLKEGEEGPARRFLNLIDAFYDQHVFLVLSSSEDIKNIYQGNLLGFEFKRALSRLKEMQSHTWWQALDKQMNMNHKNKAHAGLVGGKQ